MAPDTINTIKQAGFRVYMRNAKDSHCYFTDGTRIGYFEEQRGGGYNLGTVHIPNRETGTGFQIERHCDKPITKELLETAFVSKPSWHYGATPQKWKSFEDMRTRDSFKREFVEV
jgi:hypothetical protein